MHHDAHCGARSADEVLRDLGELLCAGQVQRGEFLGLVLSILQSAPQPTLTPPSPEQPTSQPPPLLFYLAEIDMAEAQPNGPGAKDSPYPLQDLRFKI